MRNYVGVGTIVGTLAIMMSMHCSSSSTSSGGTDPTKCGPGPYVAVTGNVGELAADGTSHPKEGVDATFLQCPNQHYTSDALGQIHFNMTKGALAPFRLESPDDIPEYVGEWGTTTDFVGNVLVVPKIFQSVIAPDFTPDKTGLGLQVSYPVGSQTTPDPCRHSEGVTFAIPDHPEAKITYFTTDPIPKPDPNATATSTNGIASITNLPDGLTVTPTATKAGCTLTGTHDGFTGKASLVKGYITLIALQMTK